MYIIHYYKYNLDINMIRRLNSALKKCEIHFILIGYTLSIFMCYIRNQMQREIYLDV